MQARQTATDQHWERTDQLLHQPTEDWEAVELPAEELSSTPGYLSAALGLLGWVLPWQGFTQSTMGS